MRFYRLPITAALLSMLLSLASAGIAQAGPLDDAKAQGLIGERADGYVGAVSAEADVQALIDKVNAGRQAKYAEIAAKRGAPVAAVAAIAGKKLIERSPAGQYIMDSSGQWRKK